jgi:hypothetical protein
LRISEAIYTAGTLLSEPITSLVGLFDERQAVKEIEKKRLENLVHKLREFNFKMEIIAGRRIT